MLPYSTLINIDGDSTHSVYLQISMQLSRLIQDGTIARSSRLPSSRRMAELLGYHRKTIIMAYDDLEAQGWIETRPSSGSYIVEELPTPHYRTLTDATTSESRAPLYLYKKSNFLTAPLQTQHALGFNDGVPDARLAPIRELGKAYHRQLHGMESHQLSYGDARGTDYARSAVADYLNQYRGLSITADNVLLTRGSIMGINLCSQLLIEQGDIVAMSSPGYSTAELCFRQAGAEILRIPVDERGIVVDELARELADGLDLRVLFITPHHHYPTSVTLSQGRRLELLELAAKHEFAIIEDDYSFDYHYGRSPILPMASADRLRSVLYIGSFSKAIAPAFRVGYVVAPTEVIDEMLKHRRIIDRQGDHILENAIADLLTDGTITRYMKKTVKSYSERLDHFCTLFERHGLHDYATFDNPAGGMAAWVRWDETIDLRSISAKAKKKGLYISNGLYYRSPLRPDDNAIRMGFATLDHDEMEHAFQILSHAIHLG